MKSNVSPIWLTYFMVRWDEVKQEPSEQKCTECGGPLNKTEVFDAGKGQRFEGYVCHLDRRVTWIRIA